MKFSSKEKEIQYWKNQLTTWIDRIKTDCKEGGDIQSDIILDAKCITRAVKNIKKLGGVLKVFS